MRKARRFVSREKQVFLVGFSLTFPRFSPKTKNRLKTSLDKILNLMDSKSKNQLFLTISVI